MNAYIIAILLAYRVKYLYNYLLKLLGDIHGENIAHCGH